MWKNLQLLSIFSFVLAIITFVDVRSGAAQQITKPRSLELLAKQAKAKGEQEISLPTDGIVDYGSARTVEEALSHFSLIVGVLEKAQSYLQEPDDITTWYRFKIIETLHQAPKDGCADCSVVPDPPADLTQAQDDELLIPRNGGT